MRLAIDNTTWFFSVVGAPYIPERHADCDVERHGTQRNFYEIANLSPSHAAGSWLNDNR